MRMDIGLSQVMAQKQILSPQMIQSMEILCLNSQQLDERIEQELEENIALELTEPEKNDSSSEIPTAVDTDLSFEPGEGASAEGQAELKELQDQYERLAEIQAEQFAHSPGSRFGNPDAADDKLEAMNNTAGKGVSLQEHLIAQLRLQTDLLTGAAEALRRQRRDDEQKKDDHEENSTEVQPADLNGVLVGGESATDSSHLNGIQETSTLESGVQTSRVQAPVQRTAEQQEDRFFLICEQLICNLDGQGRLMHGLEGILEALNAPTRPQLGKEILGPERKIELPVLAEELDLALCAVQSLDPAGVGAIGEGKEAIKHCLLLQLQRDEFEYRLEKELIRNHLEDIAKNRLPQIAKSTGSTIEDVKDAIDLIRTLDPLPGKEFQEDTNSFVKIDVFIEDDGGVYKVISGESATPRLRISSFYQELLDRSKKDPEIRKYIKKKIDSAEWLLHAIQQRKSTLQRVAEEVVEYQQEFFHHGLRALKPLKMQDIADKIGVNVSTVSRAISGKYFQAPGSIKEMKFFFTGGTVKDDGSTESRDSVILRIKDLIAEESHRKPLSDAKIVELLAEDGIHISRRTVTKYREAESIPSSRERRQF